jgi:RimJ/RimL family protein N-acetyltransferase
MSVSVREINPDDADMFLRLKTRLDHETSFMMYEPGERATTASDERARIERLLTSGNSTVLVAQQDGLLVGYVAAEGGEFRRVRHKAYVTAGVLQEYAGHGIGTLLFQELERWARDRGISRLELTVQTRNAAGVRLYSKMGYEIECTIRRSMLIDGEFVDEYMMAKLLDPEVTR